MRKPKEVIANNSAEGINPPIQQGYFKVPGAPYVIRQAPGTYIVKEDRPDYTQAPPPKARKKGKA